MPEHISDKTIRTLRGLRHDRMVNAALVLALIEDNQLALKRVKELADTNAGLLYKNNREAYNLAQDVKEVAADILPHIKAFCEKESNGPN